MFMKGMVAIMKIKEGFLMKEVAGSYVIVPVGENMVDFSAMITTNETGAFLWEQLKSDTDIDALVKAVMSEYEIDDATARTDVEEYLRTLTDKNVLTV